MKVLILNHNLKERGTYFRAWKVAEQLSRRKNKVTFVTSGEGWYRARRYRKGAIKVVESPSWWLVYGQDAGWSPLGLIVRLFLVLTNRFDIVYSFSHKPVDYIPAQLAQNLWRAKWVTDWCDLWGGAGLHQVTRDVRGPARTWRERLSDAMDPIDWWLERAAIRHSNMVTVISRYLGRRSVALGKPASRVHFMISGADMDRIQPLDKRRCRAALDLPLEGVVLGYVANWFPDEAMLMDALEIIVRKRPAVKIIVAGPPFQCGERELERRGITRCVHHFGRIPFARIPVFLGAADVLLMPLRDTVFNRSRWPNKIGDHLAAGRPQVASLVGEVAPIMQQFDIGIGCLPDATSFAEATIGLIDAPERCEQWGRNAHQLAKEQFDWTEIVERLCRKMKRELGPWQNG